MSLLKNMCRWLVTLGSLLLTACGSFRGMDDLRPFVKAKAVAPSPFLKNSRWMVQDLSRAPFHGVWSTPDRSQHENAKARREIFIAPVSLKYLRPISQKLAELESRHILPGRQEAKIAEEIHRAFTKTFIESPRPRYRVVTWPTPRSLTLELALVELNPTCGTGNALKTAASFVVGPVAGLAGFWTKGNIAIEGRVSLTDTGQPIYEFADNEEDKFTFYSLRDYQPYGHARAAITEWARQFEEISRTHPSRKVDESPFWTLEPW